MAYKKIFFYLFLLLPLAACNQEEEDSFVSGQGFMIDKEFVRLTDNDTQIAGELSIRTDAPEITIRWNTNQLCNLDTMKTVYQVNNGKITLPIRWNKSLKDGKYGPVGIAYKAGVQITAGEHSQYIPLVWAEGVDSTQIVKSARQSRSADLMPRVTQVTMLPTTVYMPEQGTATASMKIGLEGVSFAVLDISDFLREYRIDTSKIPAYLTETTFLTFKWLDNTPSSFSFATKIIARADGIVQTGYVTYSRAANINIMTIGNESLGGTVVGSNVGSTTFTSGLKSLLVNPNNFGLMGGPTYSFGFYDYNRGYENASDYIGAVDMLRNTNARIACLFDGSGTGNPNTTQVQEILSWLNQDTRRGLVFTFDFGGTMNNLLSALGLNNRQTGGGTSKFNLLINENYPETQSIIYTGLFGDISGADFSSIDNTYGSISKSACISAGFVPIMEDALGRVIIGVNSQKRIMFIGETQFFQEGPLNSDGSMKGNNYGFYPQLVGNLWFYFCQLLSQNG